LGTREFLQIDWKQGKVLLAKLFKQYAEDFGPGSEDVGSGKIQKDSQ
jgi:hypothetical protein